MLVLLPPLLLVVLPKDLIAKDFTEETKNIQVKIIRETPRSYIEKKFGKDARIALAIVSAESSWNEEAVNKNKNGSIDVGLFQVNSIHGYDIEDLKDPFYNIDIAYKIFKRDSWKAWATYNNGRYKNFLK